MKLNPSRLLAGLVATTSLVHAHPGHDDHDFTWELSHLAQHPGATLGCAAVMVGVTWVVWKMLRRANAAADQSLRGSQVSRGK